MTKITTMLKDQRWNEWFAGIIDGDGCFYINKHKEISFEITTHITDAKLLHHIKHILTGGSVKQRSNSQSVRYRVKKKSIIFNILNRINGKLWNPTRLCQFNIACNIMNIVSIDNIVITNQSPYLAGLMDSDGTITIGVSHTSANLSTMSGVEGRIQRLIYSRGYHQLSLKVAGINKEHIFLILQVYELGSVYNIKPGRKSKKVQYHWVVRTEQDFMKLYECFKKFPLKSVKMHRIRLLPIYFKYKQLKYHLSKSESLEFKQWQKFCRLWYKYSY